MRILRCINAVLSSLAVIILHGYQRFVSPLLPRSCRYSPSCSQYMIDAIRKKGFLVGLFKGVVRMLRCNPLFPGGYDPVE